MTYDPKRLIRKSYKPVLIVDDPTNEKFHEQVCDFILKNKIMVLNVFGHRDAHLSRITTEFLVAALTEKEVK